MRRLGFSLAWLSSVLLLAVLTPTAAFGQAEPAGLGPGSYIQVGASFSTFNIQYGQRDLSGGAIYVDAHLYRRIGAEAEVRTLRLNEDEGVHETTYLVGPRFSFLAHGLRPYTKFLVGRADFTFPFHYAQGSYFVIAPGAGVDWHLRRTPLSIRLLDVEYQNWPGFSFGAIKPYGISTGIALRVF